LYEWQDKRFKRVYKKLKHYIRRGIKDGEDHYEPINLATINFSCVALADVR